MSNSSQQNRFILSAIWLAIFGAIDRNVASDESILSRPVAIAVSAARPYAYIGNQSNAFITEVHTQSFATRRIQGDWGRLSDLVLQPQTNLLIAVSSNPPRIHEVPVSDADEAIGKSFELPGVPNRIALSLDGRFACISMTWLHAVCLFEMNKGRIPVDPKPIVLQLAFQPQGILALDNGLFLIADAFGGQLAAIDSNQGKAIATHKILGHHIGGMTRNASTKTVSITHQRLSAIAQTNRDDIHWGTLMQNVVSTIPEAALIDSKGNFTKSTQRSQLGIVGNGAADPTDVVCWDGSLMVAISGTNQIAFRNSPSDSYSYKSLDQPPTRLARLSSHQFLWISTLGNTAGIMEFAGDRLELRHTIGQTKSPSTPEELGELAFYSGKLTHDGWMSCNSCHVNGHSPDLLADTQGDDRFDNPKRIPSLLNVASTGPWAWNGSQSKLEEQIEKTLATTMHRDLNGPEQNTSNAELAKNMAAYLRTLQLPLTNPLRSTDTNLGASLFSNRGCNRCHQPDQQYTSPDTYDVGVNDEAGETRFNPPSLVGLRYRRALFHDARYRSLEELLPTHPDPKREWTAQEIADIKEFLLSL